MSYTLIKNLRVNKLTGVISGELAESNVTDWNGKRIYEYQEDIYQNKEGTRTALEKYSRFISDVLAGNLQGSLGKYNKLSIPNFYTDLHYFMRENKGEDPYVLTYKKYEQEIEKALNGKPEYKIKLDTNTYLVKLNERTYRSTWNEQNAKLFSENDFLKIKRSFENPIAINVNTKEEINLKYYERPKTPSELEKNYDLKVLGRNESFNTISKKIKDLELYISSLSNKNVNKETIEKTFKEGVSNILGNYLPGDKAFFTFGRKTEEGYPNILIAVYPDLKEVTRTSGNKEYYVGYTFKGMDIEKGLEQEYDGNGMMISYILDNEETAKEVMFNKLKDFEEVIRDFEKQQEVEDEEDLEE